MSIYTVPVTSQTACRVLVIGIVLSCLHTVGILVSVYLLLCRLMEPDLPEKSIFHICTAALVCPFYRILTGLTGISVQLVASVFGLTLNLILVLGVIHGIVWALLTWLLAYSVAISGCVILFGLVLNLLIVRDDIQGDVHTVTYLLCLVPLLIGIFYIIFWFLVFKLWRKLRDRDNQVFACIE